MESNLFPYHCPPDKLTGLTGLGILSNKKIKETRVQNEERPKEMDGKILSSL